MSFSPLAFVIVIINHSCITAQHSQNTVGYLIFLKYSLLCFSERNGLQMKPSEMPLRPPPLHQPREASPGFVAGRRGNSAEQGQMGQADAPDKSPPTPQGTEPPGLLMGLLAEGAFSDNSFT